METVAKWSSKIGTPASELSQCRNRLEQWLSDANLGVSARPAILLQNDDRLRRRLLPLPISPASQPAECPPL